MNKPVQNVVRKKVDSVVLIVDKIGVIGEALTLEFAKDYFVVFLTKRPLKEKNENISQVLFKGKVPKVPNNNYTKIFIVDDGDSVTRESAFSFISKAKSTNSEFYFLCSIRNVDLKYAEEITRSYIKAKVFVFGDIFDKEILFDREASITKFILEAKKNKRIIVSENGLSLNYPISFQDSIKLIIKASYIEIPQRIILLFYPHPITDISLANLFQKIDPDISVDFSKRKKERQLYLPEEGSYALSKYDLKDRLEEIGFENQDADLEIENEKKQLDFKYVKIFGFFLLTCLFLFLLPLISTSTYLYLAKHELISAKKLAEKGDFNKALKKTNNSQTFFQMAEKTSGALEKQAKLIGKEDSIQNLYIKIDESKNFSIAVSNLLDGAIQFEKIYNGKSIKEFEDFNNGVNSFKTSYTIFQTLKSSENIPIDLKTEISSLLPVIELISNSSETLPEVLGFNNEKKYLILFQNNLILRPGGGVVDSIGIITIKNGKAVDFKMNKVADLNKNIKTRVEPPFAIRRYLTQKKLTLRDSNYDLDFVNGAISAANIYKLSTSEEVDGVIAVDLEFAKNILKTIGPVNVDGLSEKVNSENLNKHALEKNDFIQNLTYAISTNLSSDLNKNYISVFKEIGNSISEKHLLFAFRNQEIQNIFTANDLSGSFNDNRKKEVGDVNDFFGISEANMSTDLVNYFISRSVSREIIVGEDGEISSVATITFKNSSQKEFAGKTYKNYFQLILPEGSKIKEISVGGEKKDIIPAITDYTIYERKGFDSSKKFEIEESIEGDKSIFGFFVLVPPDSVKKIVVTYVIPFKVLQDLELTKYSLMIYKQPGIDSYPFELIFNLPKYLTIRPSDTYSSEIRKSEEIHFTISQN